ncbi:uncharacterized protein FIBRA_03385 [Fibroporia radiculosa]|uniref:ubiquitinyl hydrolase 1 n=1 Tax=Fibroporia radiculosa TaxID=599839 RepID=J4I9K8_9APHY|nr:uncharacterized protein FIBRA_03385 [Fibroporia radiculosa]CCM01336.1 predicted protein [Fibroporia radiculosa]
MPGVAILPPPSSALRLPPSSMQNGVGSFHGGTVADIKEVAKEQAKKVRGATAISLLKGARSQIHHADDCELAGDLKGALSAITKAVSLVQMFMDSAEFKIETQPGRKGVLVRDLLDFQQHEGRDLKGKMESVEAKLVEAERSSQQDSAPDTQVETGAIRSPGGSIADRMRSLASAGLAVSTTKRFSREVAPITSASVAPPLQPTPTSVASDAVLRPNRISLQNLPSLPANFAASLASPVVSSAAPVLVPTSSFGPPSPTSSTSSSPRVSHLSLSDFTQAFPSIDELDEADGLRLSSVPTGSSKHSVDRPLPYVQPKPFPALPMDYGPRPSSTPIPPTIDTFASRPASPSRSPMSPTVPRKPSGLSLKSSASRSPILPVATPITEKPPDLPVSTTLFPRTLFDYNNRSNFKVLVLDVRTREEFDKEHIKADAVVCIEPTVLLRSDVSPQSIEDSLVVAPRDEWVLFSNRDKFDLVAIYDNDSETFGELSSPLSSLVRAIYEVAFRKFLKHSPMLLVGGLQAWKKEFGEAELVRGSTSGSTPTDSANVKGLVNGLASVNMNGTTSPSPSYAEMKSPSIGHIRAPAETGFSTTSGTPGRLRSGTEPHVDPNAHKPWLPSSPDPQLAQNQIPASMRSSIDGPLSPTFDKRLARKSAISRPPSNSISYSHSSSPAIPEHAPTQHFSPPLVNGTPAIQYPAMSRNISPQLSGSSFSSAPLNGVVSMPPQASINPSPLSRRRSDYIDQSQEALSGLSSRGPIDYPDLSSQHVLRPPPAAASSVLERQDNRPRLMQTQSFKLGPRPPTIQSDYPVTYWADTQIGTSGLKNLGNTCYMNSTIQCLSATVPFARFFTDGRWKSAVNMMNPMGTKGNLAHAFANILRDMWQGELQCLSPVTFRRSLCQYAPQFGGTEQHDSQEFLNFLLDGLHEDLNRVLQKPQIDSTPEREAELERLPTQIASEQEWQIWRMRNDSLVVDFFQGQFRNRLECLTCHKTSTTYNTFMYLTLPIPTSRSLSKVSLSHCLDAFVKEEVMEKSDAWNCPHCKTLRKATKNLSLSRLPPVLLIHLKRFSSKGHFTDKIETFVDYPLRGLDLTNYMPPPLPPGVNAGPQMPRDDPRAQIPPYRYDLYGVTNHFGTLSSGHYTAFISSRGGWLYCDDSRISQADPKDVVGKPAYMLFYKRTKA